MSLAELKALISENNDKISDKIIANVSGLINERMDVFEKSTSDNIKKIKSNNKQSLKRKANVDQHDFNAQLLENFEEVEDHLLNGEQSKAVSAVHSGVTLLKNRQKLICLADGSIHGWNAVQEYVVNDIMEDSEDDRRWKRAEARADKTRKRLKSATDSRKDKGAMSRNYVQQQLPNPMSVAVPPGITPRAPRRCFACGDYGHLRAQCVTYQSALASMGVARGKPLSKQISDILDRPIDLVNSHSDVDQSHLSADSIAGDGVSECGVVPTRIDTFLIKGDGSADVTNKPVMIGRLKSKLEFWRSITDSEVILDVVKNGYPLPLIGYPPNKILINNKSSLCDSEFVESSITELLAIGSVEECDYIPTVVNPLTVSTNGEGKKRLILDLRYVNLFLCKNKFRLEDIQTAKDLLTEGDFMFKFDLRSGYHHIEITSNHCNLLGFSWKFGDKTRYFRFAVLAFGVSTAPYLFTKVLRCLVLKWRSEGKRITLYLDDGLCMRSSSSEAAVQAVEVQQDLADAGFLANDDKSEWSPKQRIVWLGVVIDTCLMMFYVTDSRISKLKRALLTLLEAGHSVPVRQLASIAGQIISMFVGIGRTTRLMTRAMYAAIESVESWWSSVVLDDAIYAEIYFWIHNVDSLNGRKHVDAVEFHDVVYSDASDTGYGGYNTTSDNK